VVKTAVDRLKIVKIYSFSLLFFFCIDQKKKQKKSRLIFGFFEILPKACRRTVQTAFVAQNALWTASLAKAGFS
jgi:hypothetical protein